MIRINCVLWYAKIDIVVHIFKYTNTCLYVYLIQAIFMDLLKSLKAERRESATANWHLVFGWTCKSGDNRYI